MYIYKTTNLINNKIYIGLKTKTPEESTDYLGSGTLLRRAIAKYGKENFRKDILAHSNDIKTLRNMEIHYIKEHNSQDKSIGYNLIAGGGGFLNPSDELREQARQRMLNISDETREKMSKSAKARKTKSYDRKVGYSKSTREAMSKAKRGCKLSESHKEAIRQGHLRRRNKA